MITINFDDIEYYSEIEDGVIGEWTCHDCGTQNEIPEGEMLVLGDVVKCSNCGLHKRVVQK